MQYPESWPSTLCRTRLPQACSSQSHGTQAGRAVSDVNDREGGSHGRFRNLSRLLGGGIAVFVVGFGAPVSAYAAGASATPTDSASAGQAEHLVMMFIYATVALFFSFLCSVAEAVLLSITASYLGTLEATKPKIAKKLSRLKEDIDRPLAAILTLNTIAHTAGAGGAGAEAAVYFGGKYVGIAMAVLTLMILFLSEIVPKTVGAIYWRSLAPVTAIFVQGLIWVLYPLILVTELLTHWLASGKPIRTFSRDEFAAMADIGVRDGLLDDKESRILTNLFRLPGLVVEDIMTPRPVVFALQQDTSVEEVLKTYPEISFSRIPVYAATEDEVTGFVLKTDILLSGQDGNVKLGDLKRELRAVHEQTKLSKVLEDLLDHRAHIMLVVDEFGSMRGIVTLEDVVETLIGMEIVDEADQIDNMRRLARQKWEERMQRVGIDVRAPESEEE
ncbi:MAG: CNNM domain-containing protein [Planctomycetota bacterium]